MPVGAVVRGCSVELRNGCAVDGDKWCGMPGPDDKEGDLTGEFSGDVCELMLTLWFEIFVGEACCCDILQSLRA